MATGTAGTQARETHLQVMHYLRKRVTYADVGIDTGIAMPNPLPAGAEIAYTDVKIVTAFNAGTTNVLTVGQNSTNFNDMVAAGDVDESAAGVSTKAYRGADLTISADTTVKVKYTQTGAAATAGVAIITIAYTVNNDA